MLAPAFRYNSGIIRFNATPFLDAVGGETSAGLVDRHGNPISASKLKRVDAIHRTDWQGRQLLYPTARTNIFLASELLTANAWVISNALSVTQSTDTYGTSGIPYFNLQHSSTGVTQSLYQVLGAKTAGFEVTVTLAIKGTATSTQATFGLWGSSSTWGASDGSTAKLTVLDGPGVVAQQSPVALISITGLSTAQDTLISFTRTYATAETCRLYIYPDENTSTTTGAANLVTRVMGSVGSGAQGAYIKTPSNSTATVTDYTLSGATVNFGEAANAGALYDWDGIAVR